MVFLGFFDECPDPGPELSSNFVLGRIDQAIGVVRRGQAEVPVQPCDICLVSLASAVVLTVAPPVLAEAGTAPVHVKWSIARELAEQISEFACGEVDSSLVPEHDDGQGGEVRAVVRAP